MGMSALSLFTHGWHHPGEVSVEVAEHPEVLSVVEVRPSIRSVTPPQIDGPTDRPAVVGAVELRPVIESTEGPQQQTGGDTPAVTEATELAPKIEKAEEE